VKEIREGAAGSVFEGFLSLAGQLKARPDADDLIAFLLKYFFTHHRMEKAQAALEAERSTRRESPRPPSEGRRPPRGERPPREKRTESARPPRRDRPAEAGEDAGEPRRRTREAEAPEGQVRLWVNLGRSEGQDEASIRAAFEELGASTTKLVRLDVRPTYTYAWVAEADAATFEALNGKTHGNKALKIERARRR
jgi:ATP-dependent RNA helicase DeaD